jgi:hypothetical protein
MNEIETETKNFRIALTKCQRVEMLPGPGTETSCNKLIKGS